MGIRIVQIQTDLMGCKLPSLSGKIIQLPAGSAME